VVDERPWPAKPCTLGEIPSLLLQQIREEARFGFSQVVDEGLFANFEGVFVAELLDIFVLFRW